MGKIKIPEWIVNMLYGVCSFAAACLIERFIVLLLF